MKLAWVDRDEVAIFEDKHGVLKTSNIKWNDTICRCPEAAMDYIPVFTDSEKIQDSGTSMEHISGVLTGELFINGNKITVLRDPTSGEDAATKRYVNSVDGKLSTVDGILSTLRAEYDVHVGAFRNLRKNFRKIDEIAEGFFGKPFTVDTKVSDIKTSIDTIKKTQEDIVGDTRNIINKIDLLEKHQVTGVYILYVFSSTKFEIFTTYPWRHSTDKFTGTVSVILNRGGEKIFVQVASDKN
ncbi:hypothetical protein ACJMK2_014070 [Sinanodonta woodiana]|uniref:Uncharacterized protein n=1 Tax=Sinanodonta woodiana TaxID=1069815 RepID=A0ABD3V2S0_SINWO